MDSIPRVCQTARINHPWSLVADSNLRCPVVPYEYLKSFISTLNLESSTPTYMSSLDHTETKTQGKDPSITFKKNKTWESYSPPTKQWTSSLVGGFSPTPCNRQNWQSSSPKFFGVKIPPPKKKWVAHHPDLPQGVSPVPNDEFIGQRLWVFIVFRIPGAWSSFTRWVRLSSSSGRVRVFTKDR